MSLDRHCDSGVRGTSQIVVSALIVEHFSLVVGAQGSGRTHRGMIRRTSCVFQERVVTQLRVYIDRRFNSAIAVVCDVIAALHWCLSEQQRDRAATYVRHLIFVHGRAVLSNVSAS